ncbi:pyridoxamine 5'-phosphate oxidase family protein [Kineobactrum salinum]|uniref:Pyridoxamine 5-phosphate oxidase n=1 Tax=Kineobactrum salinum TaxID=2708301 RepID=A0A6C0U648_9GAMM|nr:pyridoxamine 5'-phosphate oxidase family protein [Kineobactrum salinum]QIB66829.1 pyridoxamine 5-phosphate oxidase [Kineobactrum salinum]
MYRAITDISVLESLIGKAPRMMMEKAIDHLDSGAQQWIAYSPIIFLSFGFGTDNTITIAGGKAGFVKTGDHSMSIPKSMIDNHGLAKVGMATGSLILLPGIRETMRVNGVISRVDDSSIVVEVKECFTHCGKSIIRAEFWSGVAETSGLHVPEKFAEAGRYLAIATISGDGNADVSPKGDKAGDLAHIKEGALCFADRPGNKRFDSFRNILTQPKVSAIMVVPGTSQIMHFSGIASITDDDELRASFEVQNKIPLVVTIIENVTTNVFTSGALERAQLWTTKPIEYPFKPSEIMAKQTKLMKSKGLAERLVKAAASSSPGLLEKGMEHDYKKNLY